MKSRHTKFRAIYIGDVRHEVAPIFEFNPEEQRFEMTNNLEFSYSVEQVIEDDDFIVCKIWSDEFEPPTDMNEWEFEIVNKGNLATIIDLFY